MGKIKATKISELCPNCNHAWGREPSRIERIFGGAASGMIDLRLLLYLWNPRCAICNKKFESIDQVEDEVTIDHIIPKSGGGKNHITNYQLAHESCNSKKGGIHHRRPYTHTNKIRIPDDLLAKMTPKKEPTNEHTT